MDIEALRATFTSLPVDIVAAALFATVVTVDTLRAGASRAIAFSLSLCLTPLIFAAIPVTAFIGAMYTGITNQLIQAGLFGLIVITITLVLYRAVATLSDDSGRPLPAIVTGIATTIVLICVWLISPELQVLWTFNPIIPLVFGEAYRLYWIILALVAFAFVKS